MFINENIEDFLKGKQRDEIEKDFKEKYGIQYYDLEETLKRLKSHDVKIKNLDINDRRPIEIQGYSVQSISGGTAWDLGTCINKNYAKKLRDEHYKYVDFWKNNVTFGINNDSISSTIYVSHIEALKILDRLEHES